MTKVATEELSGQASSVRETSCCIVGGGPAGAVLALLLARQSIPVVLLEAHKDFDRDFRGDTLHPSVLELMGQIGLVDRLLQIRHSKLHSATLGTPQGPLIAADFRRLDTPYPFIALLPQADFLEFITNEAKRYPTFVLTMGARVEELITEDGEVCGVRYRIDNAWHEVRAELTVAADGRSSRMRHLTGLEPIKTSLPIDVLWFRIPRKVSDPEGLQGRFGSGHGVVMLDRLDQWQVGFVIFKGTYGQIRAAGLPALRQAFAETVPEFADRIEHLTDWKQVAMLSVESSRLKQWYLPGLMLIGDAAHVMSPVGGVGINYAIQDAVVASNILSPPLKSHSVTVNDLEKVQREREWPTRVIQAIQSFAQRQIITNALKPAEQFRVPGIIRLLLKIPYLRDLPARIIGFGVRRVHVAPPL